MSRPSVKSLVVKRTGIVGTHKTSVSIESEFWNALKEIAAAENLSLKELVTQINRDRQHANLSSAIRLFVLEHYVRLADEHAGEKEGDEPSRSLHPEHIPGVHRSCRYCGSLAILVWWTVVMIGQGYGER